MNIVGKGEKNFFNYTKVLGLSNVNIISCQVQIFNIFTELLNEKEAIVFGDYGIFVCFNKAVDGGKCSYDTKVKREVFCEKIMYKNIVETEQANRHDLDIMANCELNLSNLKYYNASLGIKVEGKISINISSEEIILNDKCQNKQETEKLVAKENNSESELSVQEDIKKTAKDKTIQKNNNLIRDIETPSWEEKEVNEESDIEVEVLEFDDDEYSIEELMEMDFETLKTIIDE